MKTSRVCGVVVCAFLTVRLASAVEPVKSTALWEMSPAQIAGTAGKTTVDVRSSLPGGSQADGSGFLVDGVGTIVTNFHCVQNAQHVEIHLASGDVYHVLGVRSVDRARDIAVLQTDAFGLSAATLGNSDAVRTGDRVVVVGNAFGFLENKATPGRIGGLRDRDGYKYFQLDAAVSSGNSGSPVINERGEVIGITVFKHDGGDTLNYAIPINDTRALIQLEPKPGMAALRVAAPTGGSERAAAPTVRSERNDKAVHLDTVRVDGHAFEIAASEDMTVAMHLGDGDYLEGTVFITNTSPTPLTVDPALIDAMATKTSRKGQVKEATIHTYSADEYIGHNRKRANLRNEMLALGHGLHSASANQSAARTPGDQVATESDGLMRKRTILPGQTYGGRVMFANAEGDTWVFNLQLRGTEFEFKFH